VLAAAADRRRPKWVGEVVGLGLSGVVSDVGCI
jgi:hypothetical protein